MTTARFAQIVPYRCRDCRHEFRAGPGPVMSQTRHALPGGASAPGACPACGGLYVGRLAWFVVATNPQADAAVADRLAADGHGVLFLHYLVAPKRSKRLSRKQRQEARSQTGDRIKRPMMPGYVFVRMVASVDAGEIAHLPGVAGLLSNQSGPAPIRDDEIDRLLSGAGPDGRVVIEDPASGRRPPLRVGSLVRITVDPFRGFEGPVGRDDGQGFVRVETRMFGRPCPVDVPYGGVEVLSEAA